jgi:YVTN family beta-propeller protein
MRLFSMNSGHALARLVQSGAVVAAVALVVMVAGCGNEYRPVVTPINTSGPGAQPTSNVAVVSAPSPTTPGVATIIDYSGDSVLAEAPIGPGPVTFTIDETASNGYTVNSDGTLSNFPISSSLQAKQVTYSTLSSTALPVNLFSPNTGLWAADLNGNDADVFGGVLPAAFKLAVPVAPTPVMIIGPGAAVGTSSQRNYAISQNIPAPTGVECNTSPATQPIGMADAIETVSNTVSASLQVGKCPVFAVQTPDNRRVFVLNRGGDTTNPGGSITVINSQLNTLDNCAPFLNQDGHWVTCHQSIPLPAGPVYAEYNAATQQLVVANYDSNSISIIDVSLDEYGNDSNTYANNNCTTYSACGAITGGFGTVYTVPVGNNPASVTVLFDGSRAYTANQTDSTVTIVNLSTHTVEKTLPVIGHPRTVVSTQNSLEGKVYIASPDSPYLTILRTDLDLVDTTILVEGNIVDVRVGTQSGTVGNSNMVSRTPGFGQPCDLPPSLEPTPTGSQTALQVCRQQP